MKIIKWLNKLEALIKEVMDYTPWNKISDIVWLHDRRCDLAKLNMVIIRANKVPCEKYFKLYEGAVGLVDNLDVALGNKVWYSVQLNNGRMLLNAIKVNKELERKHQ